MKKLVKHLLFPLALLGSISPLLVTSCSNHSHLTLEQNCTMIDDGLHEIIFNLNTNLTENQKLVADLQITKKSELVSVAFASQPIVDGNKVYVYLLVDGLDNTESFVNFNLTIGCWEDDKVVWSTNFKNLQALYKIDDPTVVIDGLFKYEQTEKGKTITGFAISEESGIEMTAGEVGALLKKNKTTQLVIPDDVVAIADDAFAKQLDESTWASKLPSNYITKVVFRKNSKCTTIGNKFLFGLNFATNGYVVLPANLETIGEYFLSGSNINHFFILPESLHTIGDYFLKDASLFNKAIVLPSKIRTIPKCFLEFCDSFNNSIVLPEHLLHIDRGFLFGCTHFNQPIKLPDTIITIGDSFLSTCHLFNQRLSLPYCLQNVGGGFMNGCENFNHPIIFPKQTKVIGDHFLNHALAFNSPIIFSNVASIGELFLSDCPSFNQNLYLPDTLQSIGLFFMGGCRNMCSTIYTDIDPSVVFSAREEEDWNGFPTFTVDTGTSQTFKIGITISGKYQQKWLDRFPNLNGVKGETIKYHYRNLRITKD